MVSTRKPAKKPDPDQITMLTTQAHSLDAIFNILARRAINAEYIDQLDTNLKLALPAQSRLRAWL